MNKMDLTTTTINDLPPEMFVEILGYLNLSELVEKKLVSKLWNQLISSNLKISRLLVNECKNEKDRWFAVRRPVNEYLEICHPNLFVSQFDRYILSNLKYLRIHLFEENYEVPLQDLNRFALLEHLEIDTVIANQTPANFEWSLPNLRVLKVLFFYQPPSENKVQVNVDSPKLHTVCWSDELSLKSPETVRTLDASLYDAKLSQFCNVEIYRFGGEHEFANDALIQKLPKLKILDLCGDINNLRHSFESIDGIRRFLKQLLAHRRQLVRPELRLFFAGIEIQNETLVDSLDLRMTDPEAPFSPQISNEHLYLAVNPANLQDEIEFVKDVNYSRLVSIAGYEIQPDYFRRFFNIRDVLTFGQIQDPAHLTSFLKEFKYVDNLCLVNPSLPQAWYDALPTYCPLAFIYLDEKKEIELNFDFLGRFEPYPINHRIINHKIKLSSAKSLPNLLKSFKFSSGMRKFHFVFRGKKSTIRMRKSGEDTDQSDGSVLSYITIDDDYDVLVDKKLKLERVNSLEVLSYFEELEKKLED